MSETTKPAREKNKLANWIKIGGTILCGLLFTWLLTQQDWQAIGQALKELDPIIWGGVFLLHVLQAVMNSAAWFVLLHAQNIPLTFRKTNQLQFAGLFASNFLPSSIGGDVIRVFGLRQQQCDLTLGLASIFVDRLINVLGSLCFLPISLVIFIPLARSGEFSLSSAGFALVWQKTRQWLTKFIEALQFWLKKPMALVAAFLITFVAVVALCYSHYLLAIGLGMQVTFWEIVAIRTFSYLIMMIPISLNGLGLREVGMTTLYLTIGATQTQAISLVLITRLFLTLRTLPGALWISPFLTSTKNKTIDPTD